MTELFLLLMMFLVLLVGAGRLAALLGLLRRVRLGGRALEAAPLAQAEPGCAERCAAGVAHLLPAAHRKRWENEWLSELEHLKHQGATRRHRADYVIGVAVSVLRLRWELRGMPPAAPAGSSTAGHAAPITDHAVKFEDHVQTTLQVGGTKKQLHNAVVLEPSTLMADSVPPKPRRRTQP